MRTAIAAMGLAFLPSVLFAHHSRVDFDTTAFVEMEGELVGVRWRQPHPSFMLRVDGQTWELEGSGVYGLERSGIREDAFPIGERARVAGWRSKTRPFGFFVTNMLLSSGTELVLLPGGMITNRWSDEVAGGQWRTDTVPSGKSGIFRVWSAEDRNVFFQASLGLDVQLTDEAMTKMASPPNLDPCIAQGMPPIMVNPLPIEFVDRGDSIDLQLTTFGVLRTIDMTGELSTAATPATKLGYSVGRWVDDDTLEVRTTRVSWPYFDDAGRPQSENVEILEHFAVGGDGNRLEYTMTVTDPVSFVEPVTLSWYWIDIGEQIVLEETCPAVE